MSIDRISRRLWTDFNEIIRIISTREWDIAVKLLNTTRSIISIVDSEKLQNLDRRWDLR